MHIGVRRVLRKVTCLLCFGTSHGFDVSNTVFYLNFIFTFPCYFFCISKQRQQQIVISISKGILITFFLVVTIITYIYYTGYYTIYSVVVSWAH